MRHRLPQAAVQTVGTLVPSHPGWIALLFDWMHRQRARLSARPAAPAARPTQAAPRRLAEAQRSAIATAESHGHVLSHWRRARMAMATCRCTACGSELTLRALDRESIVLDGGALRGSCSAEYC